MALLVVATASCRRLPPPSQMPDDGDRPATNASGDAAEGRRTDRGSDRAGLSPRAAAIIDSIEAAVRDSFAALRDSVADAARRDSIARAEQARRDSVAMAEAARERARLDSVARAEATRQDSIAAAIEAAIEAARRDSIAMAEAARRDSVRTAAEGARLDSIAAADAARRDSIALAESARADSMAEAIARTRRDSFAAAMAAAATDVDRLREMGPSYIPYDQGPTVIWDTETQAQLSVALLPVLRENQLPARTKATFWILISREGDVVDVVLQTGSGSDAFDVAAGAFTETLTFVPAIRANRPVPAWVLREISILMRDD